MQEQPVVMGILNVTPDSFYDGGKYLTDKQILSRAEEILSQGAAFIDIGAASTRPGAADVDEETEINRIRHAVTLVRNAFPSAQISIDTWRSSVARCAVGEGANMINDVSGGVFDSLMPLTIAQLNVPYVLMHTTAKPALMQQLTLAENPIASMLQFFGQQIAIFKDAGCTKLILDPGFGFGKTLEQNYLILKNLSVFRIFEFPILIGLSRKSMIYNVLDIAPDQALCGTTALNMLALQNGADILRVHDVREAVQTIKLYQLYQKQ